MAFPKLASSSKEEEKRRVDDNMAFPIALSVQNSLLDKKGFLGYF